MFYLLLALIMLIVMGISINTEGKMCSASLYSAIKQVGVYLDIKSAEVWIL